MKALVLHRHGAIEDMVLEAGWPDPAPGPGDVVLKVEACTLNYHDLFTIRGMPGIKVPLPVIPGIDLAGRIAALGDGVTGWHEGQRVVIDPIERETGRLQGEMMDGGLAEYVRVRASQLIALPEGISAAAAAALPCAYGTAHRMMLTRGRVAAGEKVLILGASGGVGTCCVQLAAMQGCHVIAAASSDEKIAALMKLGAHEGINYAERPFHEVVRERHGKPRVSGGGGVDVIVNFTGGETWVPALRSLTKGGRMLTCGATAGYDPKTDIRFIWTFEQNILGSNGWSKDDIAALLGLVGEGRLTPVVSAEFPLDRAVDALKSMQERRVFGKIAVLP
jgi:alcohol dehydrogenase